MHPWDLHQSTQCWKWFSNKNYIDMHLINLCSTLKFICLGSSLCFFPWYYFSTVFDNKLSCLNWIKQKQKNYDKWSLINLLHWSHSKSVTTKQGEKCYYNISVLHKVIKMPNMNYSPTNHITLIFPERY